jgi:hypothetical protein
VDEIFDRYLAHQPDGSTFERGPAEHPATDRVPTLRPRPVRPLVPASRCSPAQDVL